MPARFVLDLDSIRDCDTSLVGAKAASLARMMRTGLPVPRGFCLTARALDACIAAAGLGSLIADTIADCRKARADDRRNALAQLREAISRISALPELSAELARALARLDWDEVAVRSSGTAEDLPGHSFAGQYETHFGKQADCLELTCRCWASLWTERAFGYRERNGFDHSQARMAVIVQRMVVADVSGVVFTADPVTGSRERIVIEAVRGPGEGLVSGRIVPDRLVLDRGLRISERPKTDATLSDGLATKVGRLALKVESIFGTPQDIELSVADNRIWFLQARPVTTGAPRDMTELSCNSDRVPSPPPRAAWTNVNARENLPDPLTPLAAAGAMPYVTALLGAIFRLVGLRMDTDNIISLIAGRAYINLNLFMAMAKAMPGVGRLSLEDIFGGQFTPEEARQLAEVAAAVPVRRARGIGPFLRLPLLPFWAIRHRPAAGRRYVERLNRETDTIQREFDYARMTDTELVTRATEPLDRLLAGNGWLSFAAVGMGFHGSLYDTCRRWLGDSSGAIASRLLSGLGEFDAARAGVEIWRLSRLAAATPELLALVRSARPWSVLHPGIENAAGGPDFLTAWDDFMFRHGHHCRGELDIGRVRWHEQPDYVLATVRTYLDAGVTVNPDADRKRHARERATLLRECRAKLKNPVKRLLFAFITAHAQAGAPIRENIKSVAIRRVALLRRAVVELGRRLAERGIIETGDDIFYVTLEELRRMVEPSGLPDVRNLIARRRVEHEHNRRLAPPSIVFGTYDPEQASAEAPLAASETMHGIAVSPGIATGPARVITESDSDSQVLPGEILICPHTDPGWTPLLLSAAGLVVDMGGLLSHGSIIAREYGIPAVVNVGPATRVIKTGQRVQVDGNTGTVRILDTPKD